MYWVCLLLSDQWYIVISVIQQIKEIFQKLSPECHIISEKC